MAHFLSCSTYINKIIYHLFINFFYNYNVFLNKVMVQLKNNTIFMYLACSCVNCSILFTRMCASVCMCVSAREYLCVNVLVCVCMRALSLFLMVSFLAQYVFFISDANFYVQISSQTSYSSVPNSHLSIHFKSKY